MIEGCLLHSNVPAPSRKYVCADARLDRFHKICNERMAGKTAPAWYRVHSILLLVAFRQRPLAW